MIKTRILEAVAHIACRHYRLVLLLALLLTALSLIPPSLIGMRFAFDISKMLPQRIPAARAFTRAVVDFDSADEAVVVFHLDGTRAGVERAGRIADRMAERLQNHPEIKNAFCRKFEEEEADYLRDEELPRSGLLLLDRPHLERVVEQLQPEAIRRSVARTRRRLMSSVAVDAEAERAILQDVLGLYSLFRSWMHTRGFLGEGGDTSGYLVDDHRRMLLLVVQPRQPAQSVAFSRKIMDLVRMIAREEVAREPVGVQRELPLDDRKGIEFGGGYEIARCYKERVHQTLLTTLVTSLVGVILLFGYCFRRYGVLLYVGLPLAMVVSWTVGIGWIIFGQLNVVSCAFAAVLVGLGVDYAIHIYNRYVEERVQGKNVEEAFACSLTRTGWAVFVGMVTTSLAFLALKATRFTQLSEFGVLAGLGIALSVPGMLFVLPALITWRNQQREEHVRVLRPTRFFLPQLVAWVGRHRRLVLALGVLAAGLCVLRLLVWPDYPRFDQRMSSLRPAERAFELGGEIARAFSDRNPNKLMLLAYGETEEEALDRAARQLAGCRRMKEQGHLLAYESVMEYLPAPEEQHRRLDLLATIDFERALTAFRQALAGAGLREKAFATNIRLLERHAERVEKRELVLASHFTDTPVERWVRRRVSRRRRRYDIRYERPRAGDFPLVLGKPVVTHANGRPRVLHDAGDALTVADLKSLHGKVKRITVLEKGWTVKTNIYPPIRGGPESDTADLKIDEPWLAQARKHLGLEKDFTGERSQKSVLTGTGLLAYELADVVKEDFWRVSLWVLGVAGLVLAIFFHRHPVRVVYCLLPVGLGLLFLFGFMSAAHISFNFINVLAVPIIIGLGVDNGIHLVNRFYESGRDIGPMVGDTGRAIMITSLTSMIGFGSLAVGGYKGITSMGLLSILALTSNLIASLVVFPAVLATFSPQKDAPEERELDLD